MFSGLQSDSSAQQTEILTSKYHEHETHKHYAISTLSQSTTILGLHWIPFSITQGPNLEYHTPFNSSTTAYGHIARQAEVEDLYQKAVHSSLYTQAMKYSHKQASQSNLRIEFNWFATAQ